MSAGTNYNRATIDATAGNIANTVRGLVNKATLFKNWLDTQSKQDLMNLGYTSDEADTLASAFSSVDGLGLLVAVYHGATALPDPVDFSVNVTRLAGP